MFKLSTNPTYLWPVKVEIPGEPPAEFKAEFRHLPSQQVDDLMKKAAAAELTDKQLLDLVWTGWTDAADEHGEPLAVNPENRARLAAIYQVPRALVRAWGDSLRMGPEKNLR